MAIIRIPLDQDSPEFVQQTQLDGITYTLRFHWNEREQSWYLAIGDVDDVPIVTSRKMVSEWPMLHREQSERKPPGSLWVVDLTGSGEPPGLSDLDKRVVLLYLDEEEMEAYRG